MQPENNYDAGLAPVERSVVEKAGRPGCNWPQCHRSPNPCFAWCKCRCHMRAARDLAAEKVGLRETAWNEFRDGPNYTPTDRYPVRDAFDAGWTLAHQMSDLGRVRHEINLRFPGWDGTPQHLSRWLDSLGLVRHMPPSSTSADQNGDDRG